MHNTRSTNWTAVFAAAIVGLIVYQSTATRMAAPASPSVIATVNLETVFNGLNARGEADTLLEQLADDLGQQAEAQGKAIDLLKEDMELYPKGSAKHQEAMEKFSLASLEYQAFVEFSRRKIEIEKAHTLKRIYRDIKEQARALAEEHGYDVVFVDDSVAGVDAATEVEVNRQISARRMLYVSPQLDVTQQLIDRMNEA